MRPTKTQRLLDLLALLVGNRFPVSVDQIMEQVPAYSGRWLEGDEGDRASVRRMFERDKDELRRMGIPLETRRYRVEGRVETDGYLLPRGDFYLPYLKLVGAERDEDHDKARGQREPLSGSSHGIGRIVLAESDARTAIEALRQVLALPFFPFPAAARSALRKLTFDLDPALHKREGDPDDESMLRVLERPGGADPQEVLGTLLDALYDRRRLSVRYHSIGRDVVEERELEPWGLLFQWASWYLAARDPAKDADDGPPRLFRVDRMEEARISRGSATTPDFHVPENFDMGESAGRRAWELEDPEERHLQVAILFHPPMSLLAERNGWGEAVARREDRARGQDGCVRSFTVRRMDPLLRWVLSMAGEAEVVSPPEAVDAMADMARRVRRLYREEP